MKKKYLGEIIVGDLDQDIIVGDLDQDIKSGRSRSSSHHLTRENSLFIE